MLELEHISGAQRDADRLVAELAGERHECLQLRLALSALSHAVEAWGQWTMSLELSQALADAREVLGARRTGTAGD